MSTGSFIPALRQFFTRTNAPARAPHLVVGDRGELAAMRHLMKQNYYVVARQWRCGKAPGDLDLIVRGTTEETGEPLLCIVEVKTRSSRDQLLPAHAAVDRHKRQTLRRLTRHYLRRLAKDDKPFVRFDILSVYMDGEKGPEFEHYKSAFGWSERRKDHWE